MDKAAARAAHDLMLKRIEEGLKEEDRSNAEMWRGSGAQKRLRALFELSDFNRRQRRRRGTPDPVDEPMFPGLPRKQ